MTTQRQVPSPFLLVFCLTVLAAISSALGMGAAVAVLLLDIAAERVAEATAGWMVLFSSAGLAVGAVLWAMAWLCRQRHAAGVAQQQTIRVLERLARQRPMPAALPVSSPEPDRRDAAPAQPADALLRELRELNVNLLLSDDQRRAKHRHLSARHADDLAETIQQALADEDLPEARGQFDRLMGLAPDHDRVAPLTEGIDRLRRQVEARDIADTTGRTEELMSAGQYVQAAQAAAELAARHPDAEGASALVERVRRETEAFQAEHRRRMFAKLEKDASARQWRAAMVVADELLATYPQSPEAGEVRAKLATIADNARIEEVRELRDRISDLLGRRRFPEAVERARDLIARFPDTAAATDLNGQMDRLEKLAAEQTEAADPPLKT